VAIVVKFPHTCIRMKKREIGDLNSEKGGGTIPFGDEPRVARSK